MGLTCEVCGAQIRGPPARVEIDGAVLYVCGNCSKRGTPMGPPATPVRTPTAQRDRSQGSYADMEVDPDYPAIVRHAREKMGLTQEGLGRMINVKPSVISHVETGKMKPDIILARTLSHHLRVSLLVESSELDSPKR